MAQIGSSGSIIGSAMAESGASSLVAPFMYGPIIEKAVQEGDYLMVYVFTELDTDEIKDLWGEDSDYIISEKWHEDRSRLVTALVEQAMENQLSLSEK